MGGFGGEIRARTPEEAWSKFEEEVCPEVEEQFGLFPDSPLSREAAFNTIWQDPQSHWWVLDYYFTK
jgi:hypothetical protein